MRTERLYDKIRIAMLFLVAFCVVVVMTTQTASAAVITEQTGDRMVVAGSTATFTVTASGKGTLTYQWQYRKDASSSWANSGQTGAKTATLKVAATGALSGYQFRCIVTDGNGRKSYSSIVTLTVK